jgi:hypothetical protein
VERGSSLGELLAAMALASLAILMAAPAVAHLRDAGRAAAAARHIATMFQAERWKSVTQGRTQGLYFEQLGGLWTWSEVEDGNGNGLRTAEVRSGTDRRLGGPHRLEDFVQHVRLGFPSGGPFREIPPGAGNIPDTTDPVQFGVSDIVSFTPIGSSSSGTLYLTDGRDALYAVVLYGPTVRVRVFRYDLRERTWSL